MWNVITLILQIRAYVSGANKYCTQRHRGESIYILMQMTERKNERSGWKKNENK